MNRSPHFLPVCGVLCMTVCIVSSGTGAELPEGTRGIAARYVGDAGIEADATCCSWKSSMPRASKMLPAGGKPPPRRRACHCR